MPRPLEICVEDLELPPQDDHYLRCVALPGGEPGLALDRDGLSPSTRKALIAV